MMILKSSILSLSYVFHYLISNFQVFLISQYFQIGILGYFWWHLVFWPEFRRFSQYFVRKKETTAEFFKYSFWKSLWHQITILLINSSKVRLVMYDDFEIFNFEFMSTSSTWFNKFITCFFRHPEFTIFFH